MELDAEHMAQLALEKAINLKKKSKSKTHSASDCTTSNLTLYCQQLGTLTPEQITAQLASISTALLMKADISDQAAS